MCQSKNAIWKLIKQHQINCRIIDWKTLEKLYWDFFCQNCHKECMLESSVQLKGSLFNYESPKPILFGKQAKTIKHFSTNTFAT